MATIAHKTSGAMQTVTPEQAEIWLRNNGRNRSLRPVLVDHYARAMEEGRWRTNGETIKIGSDGRLLDGQHRLHACIKSEKSFQCYVVTGIDPDTNDTIDVGQPRSAGDILGFDGITSSFTVAAAIRAVTQIRSGQYSGGSIRVAPDEMRLFLAAEPGIVESVNRARPAFKILSSSYCVALHYLFSEKDAAAADRFFTDLGAGSGLQASDPVYVLREKLLKDKVSKSKLQRGEIAALVIRAWERRRKSSDTKFLRGAHVSDDGKRVLPPIV